MGIENITTIRAYLETDKPDLINLIRLNIPTYFAKAEENDFIEYLDSKIELYYVLLINENIVGSGGVNFNNDKSEGKISWDIVHPEFQGKSLGSKLLKHRMDVLKSIPSIRKITVRTSQYTHLFYAKHGFKLLEVHQNFWADGFDMYLMEFVFKKNTLTSNERV
jgi:N-acetylglutamate synthase-like GNAT family acetyltransferase